MITTMHSDQNASPPRVEVITSVQRRRRWPTAEKIRLVEETMQPGMSVSYVARRAGVAPSLLFNWRRRMLEGGLRQADEDVVGTSRVRELERRMRELERLLGRKTMEIEILKEALDVARVKKPGRKILTGTPECFCAKLYRRHIQQLEYDFWRDRFGVACGNIPAFIASSRQFGSLDSFASGREKGFTDRAIDDLQPFLLSIRVDFRALEPETTDDLKNYLGQIAQQAVNGLRPIIHFDTHGSAVDEIYIAASKQYVSWAQLVDWLRPINIATENNLGIISAACFSMHIYKDISVERECPFFVMIAPTETVSFGFIESNAVRFYKKVFTGWDIVAAYNEYLQEKLTLFHCERVLFIALGRYIRNHCVGAGGAKRRERLLTQAISERRLPNNRDTRRSIRKQVKTGVRPTQALVNRYVRKFLIGKMVAFDLADIMEQVQESISQENA